MASLSVKSWGTWIIKEFLVSRVTTNLRFSNYSVFTCRDLIITIRNQDQSNKEFPSYAHATNWLICYYADAKKEA